MYLKYVFILSLALVACKSTHDNRFELNDVSYVSYVSYQTARSLDQLHRLKIDRASSIETNLEESIALDVRDIAQLINHGNISPKESLELNQLLILISVLHEKFEIPGIDESDELKRELMLAQERDPAYLEKIRCNDWTKPMWVGKSDCS